MHWSALRRARYRSEYTKRQRYGIQIGKRKRREKFGEQAFANTIALAKVAEYSYDVSSLHCCETVEIVQVLQKYVWSDKDRKQCYKFRPLWFFFLVVCRIHSRNRLEPVYPQDSRTLFLRLHWTSRKLNVPKPYVSKTGFSSSAKWAIDSDFDINDFVRQCVTETSFIGLWRSTTLSFWCSSLPFQTAPLLLNISFHWCSSQDAENIVKNTLICSISFIVSSKAFKMKN